MLNVGWLDREHEYSRGHVEAETLRSILYLATRMRNVMRGVQDCPFCHEESPLFVEDKTIKLKTYLGTGEIRVQDESGKLYAGPTLLYHYILVHDYLPPKDFLDAARSGSIGPRESHELQTLFLPQVVARTAFSFSTDSTDAPPRRARPPRGDR